MPVPAVIAGGVLGSSSVVAAAGGAFALVARPTKDVSFEEMLRGGRVEELRQLLNKEPGRNLDARLFGGATPLVQAAASNQPLVCELLIDRQASVEAKDSEGSTALLKGALEGHPDVCRYLIGLGASPATDSAGQSPVYVASLFGHADALQILLDSGVTPLEELDKGLCAAARNSHFRCCEVLLAAGAAVDGRSDGPSPLLLAARAGSDSICELLIQHRASVTKSSQGSTPLTEAARLGQSPLITRLLLDAKADVDAVSPKGTALLLASRKLAGLSRADIVSWDNAWASILLLLSRKADAGIPGADGTSPLLLACSSACDFTMCWGMIQCKADINARGPQGVTPLMAAALSPRRYAPAKMGRRRRDREEVEAAALSTCRGLLDHGADGSALDASGRSARDWAGTAGVCDVLRDAGVRLGTGIGCTGHEDTEEEAELDTQALLWSPGTHD